MRKVKSFQVDIFRYWAATPNLWHVQNTTSHRSITCASDAACRKIIRNALAKLDGKDAPYKEPALDRKSGQLIAW